MLKKLEKGDAKTLHYYLLNPNLLYIRYRAHSLEEYHLITEELIEKEEKGEALIRVILNEENTPIGQIALYDIRERTGFLSTWIAEEYQGKGYNQKAKDQFMLELFYQENIDVVYAKIRKNNIRSLKASAKLPYMSNVSADKPHIYQQVNQEDER